MDDIKYSTQRSGVCVHEWQVLGCLALTPVAVVEGGTPSSHVDKDKWRIVRSMLENLAADSDDAYAVLVMQRWDSINTQDCQMVQSLDNKSRLIYLQGKAKKGGLVSSRDFCYTMYK